MAKNRKLNDYWVIGQLMGIRMLEREVAAALKKPGARNRAGIQRRIAHLKSWVDALDQELGAHAGSPARA